MHTYEIEIKSLLGTPDRATSLRHRFAEVDPGHTYVGGSTQLNHYFTGDAMDALADRMAKYLDNEGRALLTRVAEDGSSFSVRTRKADDRVLFVVKASVDDTTSENGITRIEFERAVPITLDELDAAILESGYTYQAKWSREREEYLVRDTNVTIDRNAGYGYVAEFERVVQNAGDAERIRGELRALMDELGVEELPQDRLERMFAHYNEHWPEYYGTDKIFTIA